MSELKSSFDPNIAVYTPDQTDAIEEHITEHIGDFPKVFRDNSPKDLKIDIAVIPPDDDRYFLTLVTMGLGAYKMNLPKELRGQGLERAELVLCLPANWDFNTEVPETMWPVELLNRIAHLPVRHRSWIGRGHSVDYSKPFTEETDLSAVLLLSPSFGKETSVCTLPNGEKVNFYQVIPLYDIEMRYKIDHGTDALLDRFGDELDPVVDLDRRPVVDASTFELIDRVEDHSSKIEDKQLDISEINGANHIAMFLRWCIERDLIDDEFKDFFADELESIRRGELDIRKFLLNSLSGELTKEILNEEGKAFASFYYDFYAEPDSPCYPEDVDRVALEYFGKEKYECEEFADEAYLFLPYGDDYYARISRYISRSHRIFYGLD
ncbi:MAG: suppressor of fused domain protein [Ruminococcus sp.]|nr:suppressor of fused domain protein [Ruminococcus sp.]